MPKKICILIGAVMIFAATILFADEGIGVSVMFSSDISAYRTAWDGIAEYFHQRNMTLRTNEYHIENDDPNRIFSRITLDQPDIVVTFGTKASLLAREKIADSPVIFCMVFEPEKIVGANLTGASMIIPDTVLLREIRNLIPDVKTIGLIYSNQSLQRYEQLFRTCRQSGFELIAHEADSEKEVADAVRDMDRQIDCFLMIPDSKIYFTKSVEFLLLESLRERFPVVGLSSYYTKAGALFSLDCDYEDLGKQAAEIMLRILNGESPAAITPSTPRRFDLSVNLVTAARLNIPLSSDVLERSKEVFGK